jgi:sialic acid synthase SpsE
MANKSWILDAPSRQLGGRVVGTGRPVYITREIGINHNGDLANAIALIDQAAGQLAEQADLMAVS